MSACQPQPSLGHRHRIASSASLHSVHTAPVSGLYHSPYHICVLSRGALLSSAAAPGRWSWSEGMEQKRKVVEARKQARPVETRSRFQEALEGFLSVCPLRTSQRLPHADLRFHPQLRFFFFDCVYMCMFVCECRPCVS